MQTNLDTTARAAAIPLAYTVNTFCRSVGIGRSLFYQLVKDGKIRTITIGGRRLVPADEARRLLSEGAR